MTHTEHAELRRLIRSDFDYDAMMQCAWLLSAEYPFLGFGYLGESAAGRGIPRFSLGEGKKEIYYIGVHTVRSASPARCSFIFFWSFAPASRGMPCSSA